ncbi:MAG TPA: phosphotransferase family protein, partial [Actinomycetota bacterium]|nr:phosphotransferase family protein [Actinomycetota bacterium]
MTDLTELVDPAGLKRYLADTLPDYAGEFTIERLGEGQSCLTFMVSGDGWRVVLRRPPRGELPPSAFDVTREYRVMRALHGSAASVPVAKPLALCEDKSVIGANFYLMEPVDGLVVRREIPPKLDPMDERRRMCETLVDTLRALRAVDYKAAGLESFGKPEGYLERQLARMNQIREFTRFRDVPEIDEVGKWLADNIP